MPSIDDQLRDRLRASAPRPFDREDLFTRLGVRKKRRATARKVGTITLVLVVLLATTGTFVALDRAFWTGPKPATLPPSTSNGALVVSIPSGDDAHLMVLPQSALDLDPTNGTAIGQPDAMDILTNEPGTRDVDPTVSPDGTTVAFVRRYRTGAPSELWLANIDGTREHLLTRAPAGAESPAWSPDGSMIAFAAADEPQGRAVYTIHPDGSDLQVLAHDEAVVDIAWSPDGTSIVYSGVPVGESIFFADLWLASLDGSVPKRLTQTADIGEREPAWTPDGSLIAFTADDGIREMPSEGGTSQIVVPWAPGDGAAPASPAWSPDGAYLTFVFDATPPSASTIYVLPVGSSDPFPLAKGSSFAWQPVPLSSPLPSLENLGLDFPICRVMSMPITVAGSSGSAYVFTKEDTSCPKAGEGDRFVAADLTGDGVIDTPPVRLDGCFPPVGCETFAAPDVNGDGTSEIAVSNAGADGYGVWLFALSMSPPAVASIDVVDPQGMGRIQTGPLEFAWVDVVGHAEGAMCETSADGTTFSLFDYDKFGKETDLRTTTLRLDGMTATVTDASSDRIPLSDAPSPGNELCGAPLQGSAENFPSASSGGSRSG